MALSRALMLCAAIAGGVLASDTETCSDGVALLQAQPRIRTAKTALQTDQAPQLVRKGCPSRGAGREVRVGTANVRCCSMDGSQCQSNVAGGCNSDKTFQEAQDICASAQMRLCTEEELDSNVCCGTGCQFDFGQMWLADPNSVVIAPPPTTVVVRGCPSRGVDREVRSAPASVRCCSMDGSSCTSTVAGGCHTGKTFEEAEALCASENMRLCTEPEIASRVCCGTGCGFDSHHVWTVDAAALPPPPPPPPTPPGPPPPPPMWQNSFALCPTSSCGLRPFSQQREPVCYEFTDFSPSIDSTGAACPAPAPPTTQQCPGGDACPSYCRGSRPATWPASRAPTHRINFRGQGITNANEMLQACTQACTEDSDCVGFAFSQWHNYQCHLHRTLPLTYDSSNGAFTFYWSGQLDGIPGDCEPQITGGAALPCVGAIDGCIDFDFGQLLQGYCSCTTCIPRPFCAEQESGGGSCACKRCQAGFVTSADGGCQYPGGLEPPCDNTNDQFTPCQSDWSEFHHRPLYEPDITGHDPDAIGYISSAAWQAASWDGTVYLPTQMTPVDFEEAICPTVGRHRTIRGIREVFYQHNPFADNSNPTKAEVDEWHRILLSHLRALVGYTSEERQPVKDHCQFARAQWGNERRETDMWDQDYPDGICGEGAHAHCGFSFRPNAEDQAPYLPPNHPTCRGGGAEGIFGVGANVPWSLRVSTAICGTLRSETFWGGHMGPFWRREKFGWNFWSMPNGGVKWRAIYSGRLEDQYDACDTPQQFRVSPPGRNLLWPFENC